MLRQSRSQLDYSVRTKRPDSTSLISLSKDKCPTWDLTGPDTYADSHLTTSTTAAGWATSEEAIHATSKIRLNLPVSPTSCPWQSIRLKSSTMKPRSSNNKSDTDAPRRMTIQRWQATQTDRCDHSEKQCDTIPKVPSWRILRYTIFLSIQFLACGFTVNSAKQTGKQKWSADLVIKKLTTMHWHAATFSQGEK